MWLILVFTDVRYDQVQEEWRDLVPHQSWLSLNLVTAEDAVSDERWNSLDWSGTIRKIVYNWTFCLTFSSSSYSFLLFTSPFIFRKRKYLIKSFCESPHLHREDFPRIFSMNDVPIISRTQQSRRLVKNRINNIKKNRY